MIKIEYTITSGELPITVSLIGSEESDNVHESYGTYEFMPIDYGDYIIRFTDNTGCIEEEIITTTTTTSTSTSTSTTTTSTTVFSNLLTNLVSVYELDETSGTVVNDSYDSTDGTNTGTATVNQTGKINKCYDFDGTNDYIDFNTRLITSFPFSISLWFYMDTSGRYIFASNRGVTNYYGITLYADTTRIAISYGNGVGAGTSYRKSYDYSTTISTGAWYHLVVTASSIASADTKVYVNNLELTASNPTGSAVSVSFASGESHIAQNWGTATTSRWDGLIDQVAIWNRLLDSSDISYLYNSGNGLAYTSW